MGRGRESESNVQLSFPVVSVNLSYLFTSGSVTVNLSGMSREVSYFFTSGSVTVYFSGDE